MKSELEIVQEWHSALNNGDIEQVVKLVAPDVEIIGPRGNVKGADVVREWFGRANVQFKPVRFFARDGVIVVEQEGVWLDAARKDVVGNQLVATLFVLTDGLIASIARHDELSSALESAGLQESDSV